MEAIAGLLAINFCRKHNSF